MTSPSAVARRYAHALFQVALGGNAEAAVGADLESLERLHDEDPSFLEFLVSPEVFIDRKHEFIDKVFGPRVNALTVRFLHLLVDKKRIASFPEACKEFQRLGEEHRGMVRAQVRTAVPLDSDQEARLKKDLDRITGKQVLIEKIVDPSLLGGVVVNLGNRVIDQSLRRGLKRMREQLMQAEIV
jgi:F-type H+-transporting ATPase subunit delta